MDTTPTRNENGTSGATRRNILGAGALMGTLGLLTACTTPPGGSTAAAGGTGGSGAEGSAEFTDALKKLVNGRTVQVGFTPPVLSEYYTQMENAAFTRMAQLEDLYGSNGNGKVIPYRQFQRR